MTSVVAPTGTSYYALSGLDTRTAKLEVGVYTGQVRDGAGVTAPVIRDSQASYTQGVSETRAGVTSYLHSGLKDATAQSSTSQVVTATRVYDAFGMVVSSTGAWKGPFGYAGEHGYQEDSTGLQLLGHRYYDPSTGRFLTRDPAKDGRNWYGYCGNSPLVKHDPAGLWDWDQYRKDVGDIFSGYGDAISDGAKDQVDNYWRNVTKPLNPVALVEDLVEGAKGIGDAIGGLGDTSDMRGWGKRFLPLVATAVLAADGIAGGVKGSGYGLERVKYPNSGGGGIKLTRHGNDTKWRLDVHEWGDAKGIKRIHYHRPPRDGMKGMPGERPGRHRPWQGW